MNHSAKVLYPFDYVIIFYLQRKHNSTMASPDKKYRILSNTCYLNGKLFFYYHKTARLLNILLHTRLLWVLGEKQKYRASSSAHAHERTPWSSVQMPWSWMGGVTTDPTITEWGLNTVGHRLSCTRLPVVKFAATAKSIPLFCVIFMWGQTLYVFTKSLHCSMNQYMCASPWYPQLQRLVSCNVHFPTSPPPIRLAQSFNQMLLTPALQRV